MKNISEEWDLDKNNRWVIPTDIWSGSWKTSSVKGGCAALLRNRPTLPPLTIMNSTVTADLMWDNHIESIVKKAQ